MDMSSPGKLAPKITPGNEPEKLCGISQTNGGAIKGVAATVMGMKESAGSSRDLDDVTIDVSDHCKSNSQSEDRDAGAHNDSQFASFATASFSQPCPEQCGTGLISSGVRASRHTVALVTNARPRPPTPAGKSEYCNGNFLTSSTLCEQLRPRGPPTSS
jgi:hypothetical protein